MFSQVFLTENLGNSIDLNYLDSNKGWFNDSKELSKNIDTDLVMTDSVKTYNLTWIIRNMGLYVNWNFGTSPVGWWAGPFVPNFVLSE